MKRDVFALRLVKCDVLGLCPLEVCGFTRILTIATSLVIRLKAAVRSRGSAHAVPGAEAGCVKGRRGSRNRLSGGGCGCVEASRGSPVVKSELSWPR